MTLKNEVVALTKALGEWLKASESAYSELTIEIDPKHIKEISKILKNPPFSYDMLIDICGVDYLHYGLYEWTTQDASSSGFERGARHGQAMTRMLPWNKPRFGVIYHLLSVQNNKRLRVKVYLEGEPPTVDSIVEVWDAANWFEREAFDLFGIVFNGHPDLRRILTDYGFIGFPFRKDFPLSGEVEVRYDATLKRVIYEPVEIEPRVLVPKVYRKDNRYESKGGGHE